MKYKLWITWVSLQNHDDECVKNYKIQSEVLVSEKLSISFI